MGVMFLFLDGVGLGRAGSENPLVNNRWKSFEMLTNGQGLRIDAEPVIGENLCFRSLDATLGMEGLPQSGTGQASLFSGINAAELAGRHFGPFPHSKTRHLLSEESLFHELILKGLKPHFANAYPDLFFRKRGKRNRWTCTTLMTRSSGLKLNGEKEVMEGRSLTAEIVQEAWREILKLPVERITPEEAAERLLLLSAEFDLVLFEYYLTDKAGHSRDGEWSRKILGVLDRFLMRLVSNKNRNDYLLICSDHGNLENLGVKTHTRNPVPLIVYGEGAGRAGNASSLLDVKGLACELASVRGA